jgi:hypothetical protein
MNLTMEDLKVGSTGAGERRCVRAAGDAQPVALRVLGGGARGALPRGLLLGLLLGCARPARQRHVRNSDSTFHCPISSPLCWTKALHEVVTTHLVSRQETCIYYYCCCCCCCWCEAACTDPARFMFGSPLSSPFGFQLHVQTLHGSIPAVLTSGA